MPRDTIDAPGPATVEAEALSQAKAQYEALMKKSQRLTGATVTDPTDLGGPMTDYDQQRLMRGTFQIRGSVMLKRTCDLRAQLVAIRNAATSALLALERGGDPVDLRAAVQNHMNGAGRRCLTIRREAGEDWAR